MEETATYIYDALVVFGVSIVIAAIIYFIIDKVSDFFER